MAQGEGSGRRSRTWAIVTLAILAAALSFLSLMYLGWFGLGLFGLAGLYLTSRLKLFGGNPAAQNPSAAAVRYRARRQEERSRLRPEEKLAETARQDEQDRFVAVVDTICLSLAALGFGLFFLHQL